MYYADVLLSNYSLTHYELQNYQSESQLTRVNQCCYLQLDANRVSNRGFPKPKNIGYLGVCQHWKTLILHCLKSPT